MKDNKCSTENIDKFPLRQIYFYLTEGCNLRCCHCWIDPTYNKGGSGVALDFEIFKSIINQAKPLGLKGVKLTGGEPLLHPDIREIIQFLQGEDLSCGMETNGVLCSAELAGEISKCKNRFVSVSLDGSCSRTHESIRGVKGCFSSAIEGIKNLVNAGIRPQIIMTVMRRNKKEMQDLVFLAESLKAGSVKFNIVQPTARGQKMSEEGQTLDIDELIETGHWVENTLSAKTRLHLFYSHPLAFRPFSRMFGDKGSGCGVCSIHSILGVIANGAYALCGIGEKVPELVFGDAAKDKLQDIWYSSSVLNEIRKGLPNRLEGICETCIMKFICLGSCIAQNYYSSKNLFSPFWYCQEAYNRGLFPEGRKSHEKA